MSMTEDDEHFSETDVPRDFNIISWFMGIPLCDDTWLGMQAQHVAVVEIGIIRPLELRAARIIFNEAGINSLLISNIHNQLYVQDALFNYNRGPQDRISSGATLWQDNVFLAAGKPKDDKIVALRTK